MQSVNRGHLVKKSIINITPYEHLKHIFTVFCFAEKNPYRTYLCTLDLNILELFTPSSYHAQTLVVQVRGHMSYITLQQETIGESLHIHRVYICRWHSINLHDFLTFINCKTSESYLITGIMKTNSLFLQLTRLIINIWINLIIVIAKFCWILVKLLDSSKT